LGLEVDGAALLPPDNIGKGFDNIAEVLAVSPLLMEQYMFAAGRISRTAIVPSNMLPSSEVYNVENDLLQDAYMSEDLPLGSRGGIAVRHYFPKDGEYTMSIRLHRNEEGFIRGIHQEQKLDIRLDHKSIGLLKIGGEFYGRPGPDFNNNQTAHFTGDPVQSGYESSADEKLKLTFPAKAGTHIVGVSFLDDRIKPTGILTPHIMLIDMGSYKGGDPAVAAITIGGPYNTKGSGRVPGNDRIFICQPASVDEEDDCAHKILANLARRAYRQPVAEEDLNDLNSLYQKGKARDGFSGGIQLAIQGVLSAPKFLFRMEQDPPGVTPGTVYPISDMALASRLSFFLWSSIPDDELLAKAELGQLRKPDILRQQVRRMLADQRSEALIKNFGGQWLAVRNIDFAEPHPEVFLEFDEELRLALRKETDLWFDEMIRHDHGILELLTSDFTYLNERLAKHYGIPGVYGSRFRRVNLDGYDERKGLFGKGSLLTATSYNNRTSPVLRGKWVLENLLNMPPPPPPEDVPALEVKSGDGKPLTLKQAMEQHRANPVCSACHKLMDPIGFALENFDAIGAYRSRYVEADAEVDPSGILFDGSPFQTTSEFEREFLKHSERIVHTVTEKLFTYALGRGVEYYDQPVIRKIVQDIAADDYKWSALILSLVESTPFQYRIAR
jgi:hypothetical protein